MNPALERESPRRRGSAELLLPSRAAALVSVRAALLGQRGPILITGEAGVGKTWLWRRLEAEFAYPWRWLSVEVTPSTDSAELLRAIARGLGLPTHEKNAARWGFVDTLVESAAEGDRWVLVVEEAHNASDSVCEEIRVLANHLGATDGFAGIVLVGQTPLARRLQTRALSALETRLTARVHLRPLDLDEALRYLDDVAPGWFGTNRTREELHRDAAGNPRRLFQSSTQFLDRQAIAASVAHVPAEPVPAPVVAEAPAFVPETVPPAPILGPAKPPLHEEEGLIEVGWEPSDLEPSDDAPEPAPVVREPVAALPAGPAEETVNDHYAALQAWTEWAKNQGRTSADPAGDDATPGDADPADSALGRVPASSHPSVWAEGQHGFAPYSQLFSRLRQSRDTL